VVVTETETETETGTASVIETVSALGTGKGPPAPRRRVSGAGRITDPARVKSAGTGGRRCRRPSCPRPMPGSTREGARSGRSGVPRPWPACLGRRIAQLRGCSPLKPDLAGRSARILRLGSVGHPPGPAPRIAVFPRPRSPRQVASAGTGRRAQSWGMGIFPRPASPSQPQPEPLGARGPGRASGRTAPTSHHLRTSGAAPAPAPRIGMRAETGDEGSDAM
jgi:hypothetical protein